MAQYLPAVAASDAARVLVEYDPRAGAAREGDTVLGRLDALAWRRFRRGALHAVDAAVTFTERDRLALKPLAGDTPIVRIPIGTDFTTRTFGPAESDGSVLFVGNFVHSPNVDAARRLVTSIFPRVLESHPHCRLYVVGDAPPPDLVEEPPHGVTVTGWVPDLIPYLQRAAVVVAPACHAPPFQYLPVGSWSETCTELAPAIPEVESLAVPDHAVGYAVVAPYFAPETGVAIVVDGSVAS